MLRKIKRIQRAIVTPDKHFPLADMPAINVVCKAIEIVKPDIYIDLGDVGEWEAFSHWKWKKKKKPPLDYIMPDVERDIKDVNEGMDIIDESLDKVNCKYKYLTEGNHDNWVNTFSQEYPYLKLSFRKAVKLKERGYKFYPFGKKLKLGKLTFYHGHELGGQYHAANHLRKKGTSYMYGHWHDLQQMSVTHDDGAKSAWSIGCLKDMGAEANKWLNYREHNWSHAFAIVDFLENGYFTVHVIQIINGRTSLWGKLLDGNM